MYLTYKIPTLYLLRGFQGGSNRITVPLDGIPQENGDGTMRSALYTGPSSLHRYVQRAWRLDTDLTTTGSTKILRDGKAGQCESGRPFFHQLTPAQTVPIRREDSPEDSIQPYLNSQGRLSHGSTVPLRSINFVSWPNVLYSLQPPGLTNLVSVRLPAVPTTENYTSVNKTASTTFTDHANRTHYEPRGSLHYRRRRRM